VRGVTKAAGTSIEGIANTISAAMERALKGLREVSDGIAELRQAEMMLKTITKVQAIVADNHMIAGKSQQPTEDENQRFAYPIPEVARKLGLHRRTIEYKIKAGGLEVVEFFGRRLVTAESLSAALKKVPPVDVRKRRSTL
jgi:hypothetical protein